MSFWNRFWNRLKRRKVKNHHKWLKKTQQLWECICICESELVSVFAYLDPADSLLGLHHAYVLGGVPLRQQLSGAQVVSSKDNSINQVFWFARSWDWETHGEARLAKSVGRLILSGVKRGGFCKHSESACCVWKRSQTPSLWGKGEIEIIDWEEMSSEMATGCVLMEVQNWWEAGWAEMNLCLWYVDVYYLTPTLGHTVLPWSEGADGRPSPSHIPGLSICPEAGEESMGGSAMWQTEGAAALGVEPCNHNTVFSTITQVCRQMNSPSTKLGNDATFFVGWKRETKKGGFDKSFTVNYLLFPRVRQR